LTTCGLMSASLRISCFRTLNRRSMTFPFHWDHSHGKIVVINAYKTLMKWTVQVVRMVSINNRGKGIEYKAPIPSHIKISCFLFIILNPFRQNIPFVMVPNLAFFLYAIRCVLYAVNSCYQCPCLGKCLVPFAYWV